MSLLAYAHLAAIWIILLAGLGFVLIGALGLLRLPGFYNRLHAAGLTDTLGIELILLAFLLYEGFSPVGVKLILIGLFVLLTGPTATHALGHAARVRGIKTAEETSAEKS